MWKFQHFSSMEVLPSYPALKQKISIPLQKPVLAKEIDSMVL